MESVKVRKIQKEVLLLANVTASQMSMAHGTVLLVHSFLCTTNLMIKYRYILVVTGARMDFGCFRLKTRTAAGRALAICWGRLITKAAINALVNVFVSDWSLEMLVISAWYVFFCTAVMKVFFPIKAIISTL